MINPIDRNEFIEEMANKGEKGRGRIEATYAFRPLLLNQPNQYGIRAILKSKFYNRVRNFRERINKVLIRVEQI